MPPLVWAALSPAAACGGFFCDGLTPGFDLVEQTGEAVVFRIDDVADTTEMHVQVRYDGPPQEFAWVVPVRGTPQIALSHSVLFAGLDALTAPALQLDRTGGCAPPPPPPPPAPPPSESVPLVQVTAARTQVGPYETVTVSAADPVALVDWLQGEGFAVPDGVATSLAPYVADGHQFLALRLANGETSGALAPLALTFPGTTPAIPIQLTALAAAEDMPLTVYVLGKARAVPSNYLHVDLNPNALNWFDDDAGYARLVTRAADQAGGHAFATDWSNTTATAQQIFARYQGLPFEPPPNYTTEDTIRQISWTYPKTPEMRAILVEHMLMRDAEVDALFTTPWVAFPQDLEARGADLQAFLDALNTRIVPPIQHIQAMMADSPHLTRLTSSLSPAEMTVDPMFTLNPRVAQTTATRSRGELRYLCAEGEAASGARRVLSPPGGFPVFLPSEDDVAAMGLTDAEYYAKLEEPAAVRIVDFGDGGEGEVLWDGAGIVEDSVRAFNRQATGCDTGRGPAWALTLPLVLLGLRRR
ncbi:MAG: DUF2330 domain-containing protein [Alphaproteobacteria bacterium]|nr:DUF2330 domain-containing protein [Alphaproteobacteria bacterium]